MLKPVRPVSDYSCLFWTSRRSSKPPLCPSDTAGTEERALTGGQVWQLRDDQLISPEWGCELRAFGALGVESGSLTTHFSELETIQFNARVMPHVRLTPVHFCDTAGVFQMTLMTTELVCPESGLCRDLLPKSHLPWVALYISVSPLTKWSFMCAQEVRTALQKEVYELTDLLHAISGSNKLLSRTRTCSLPRDLAVPISGSWPPQTRFRDPTSATNLFCRKFMTRIFCSLLTVCAFFEDAYVVLSLALR